MSVSESTIRQVIERAVSCAREQQFSVCISVVDDAGLLRDFLRMDDAVQECSS